MNIAASSSTVRSMIRIGRRPVFSAAIVVAVLLAAGCTGYNHPDPGEIAAPSGVGTPNGAATPKRAERKNCRVLVLSPTRELSGQILESFRAYGRHSLLQHSILAHNEQPDSVDFLESNIKRFNNAGRLFSSSWIA